MISEGKFEATHDGWLQLIICTMVVVPHATWCSHYKYPDRPDDCIAPESGEDEVVQHDEVSVGVGCNWGEYIGWIGNSECCHG